MMIYHQSSYSNIIHLSFQGKNCFIDNPWILQDSNAVNTALQRIGLDNSPLPLKLLIC